VAAGTFPPREAKDEDRSRLSSWRPSGVEIARERIAVLVELPVGTSCAVEVSQFGQIDRVTGYRPNLFGLKQVGHF
jgi:hypothetical protein